MELGTEGSSKIIERYRLLKVTVRRGMDGLLLGGDRLVEITNVTQTFKPSLQ